VTALRRQLEAAEPDLRATLIDSLASNAQQGNDPATAEDLAWAILRFGLARPALRRYLIGDADIQAAEQATLVAVALRISSWRAEGSFAAWLQQVATNEARQLIRAESRHAQRRELLDTDGGLDTAPGEGFINRVSSMIANEQAVQAQLALLSDPLRHALVLREYQGLTYDEIATQLGLPLSTAKTHVRRARMALADALIASQLP